MAWGIDVRDEILERDRLGRGLRRLPPRCAALPSRMPAAAQDGDARAGRAGEAAESVAQPRAPSPNATINLVNLLVKQGVLTEEQAQALIKQAEDEAYVARQALRDAADQGRRRREDRDAAAAEAASPPGTKRVTYVPEMVKKQLREEIKQEVMAKAEKENWAVAGHVPGMGVAHPLLRRHPRPLRGRLLPARQRSVQRRQLQCDQHRQPVRRQRHYDFWWPTYDT